MNSLSNDGRPRRALLGAAAVVAALTAAACTPGPGGGTPPVEETTIHDFRVSDSLGPAPHTVAFSWDIEDPENDPLTCTLDLTSDGSVDVSIFPCSDGSLHAHTYPTAGSFTATLVVDDQNSAPATDQAVIGVSAAGTDGFDIDLRLSSGMSPSRQQAFTDAAARWTDVIGEGLDPRTITIPAGDCNDNADAFSGTIDDLLIDGIVAPIDGPGGILGQAGPCYVRGSSGLPIYGVMVFDTDDVGDLEAEGRFDDVILHEMGHVLGIGTLWDAAHVGGSGTSNPTFLGVNSRAAYSILGAFGNVPLENLGGPGTAESHWREATFGSELMTGYIDTSNPLSVLTATNLSDLGYAGIDLGETDPYSLGAGARSGSPVAPLELNEVLITPIRTV